jgi:hypothetical protein
MESVSRRGKKKSIHQNITFISSVQLLSSQPIYFNICSIFILSNQVNEDSTRVLCNYTYAVYFTAVTHRNLFW